MGLAFSRQTTAIKNNGNGSRFRTWRVRYSSSTLNASTRSAEFQSPRRVFRPRIENEPKITLWLSGMFYYRALEELGLWVRKTLWSFRNWLCFDEINNFNNFTPTRGGLSRAAAPPSPILVSGYARSGLFFIFSLFQNWPTSEMNRRQVKWMEDKILFGSQPPGEGPSFDDGPPTEWLPVG